MIYKVLVVLAGLIHVRIFLAETRLWGTPGVNKAFGITAAQAETMRLLAWNQGFYNLFLAVGAFLVLAPGARFAAIPLFACASMVGAASVLATSAPHMMRGVMIQGLPPALALLAAVWTARE